MIIILKIIDLNQQIISKKLIILFIETQNSKMTEKLPTSHTTAIFFFRINYIFFIGSLITVFSFSGATLLASLNTYRTMKTKCGHFFICFHSTVSIDLKKHLNNVNIKLNSIFLKRA